MEQWEPHSGRGREVRAYRREVTLSKPEPEEDGCVERQQRDVERVDGESRLGQFRGEYGRKGGHE